MKIKRHQIGGVVYSPFGPAPQGSKTPQQEDTPGTRGDKISGTIEGKIADILKENGIPSDVGVFLNRARTFLDKSTNLSQTSLFGGTDDYYSLTELMQIQKIANDVKWHNARRTEAAKNLDDENAWGEAAMDSRGFLYAEDGDRNIVAVNPFNADLSEYRVLSNDELLLRREQLPSLAFNTEILNTMAGTIGMKTVQAFLLDTIGKLGTTTLTGYSTKEAEDIFNGAKVLMESGPDGFYKITDKQQAKDINAALQYLGTQLKQNPGMYKTLVAGVVHSGGNPETDLGATIAQMLFQHRNVEFEADFDAATTKHHLGQTGQDKTLLTEDTYLSRIVSGQAEWDMASIVPIASKASDKGTWLVPAANVGPVVDSKGNKLPQMSVASLKQHAEAIKGTIETDVTFGNQLLTPTQDRAVLWDGNSQLTTAMLPFKNINGQYTPDFDLILRFNEYQEELRRNPNLTNLSRTELLRKYGLDLNTIEEDEKTGAMYLKNTMMFLTFSAYANDDNIDFTDETKRFTEEVSTDEWKRVKDAYTNAMKYGDTTPSRDQRRSGASGYYKASRGDKNKGKFRKGNVYMPIKSSFLGTHMSMDQLIPKDILNRFNVRSQMAVNTPQISGQF